jgi:hypothetical protein
MAGGAEPMRLSPAARRARIIEILEALAATYGSGDRGLWRSRLFAASAAIEDLFEDDATADERRDVVAAFERHISATNALGSQLNELLMDMTTRNLRSLSVLENFRRGT